MILKSFCGCLSLQSGVVILSFVFMQIAFLILAVNAHFLFDFQNAMIIVVLFTVVMVFTGLAMINAAYKEQRKMCFIALLLIAVLVLMFLGGSAASFYNHKDITQYVCVESRCPESLWVSNLQYRNETVVNGTEENNTTTTHGIERTAWTPPTERPQENGQPATPPTHPPPGPSHRRRRRKDEPEKWSGGPDIPKPITKPTTTTEEYEYDDGYQDHEHETQVSGFKTGPALIIAISLFFVNLIFFIFSALIVLSYSQELKAILKLA